MRDLPVNEKITELIGKEILQVRLGVAYLAGNILLCTDAEAGLSKTSKTRAKLAIALCFRCQEQIIELSHHTYRNSRSDWQRLGKYYTLKEVADWLSRIIPQTHGSQVHTEIEHVLDKWALKKVNCLVGGIKKRDGGELVAWEAEGVIAQIDELVPELWKVLSQEWRRSDKKHGQYYHVYHAVDHEAMLYIQLGIRRWQSPQQADFYQEVALLKVEGQSSLDEVFRLTNHVEHGWHHNREVLWFQDERPLRSTSTGDIIVSLASGATWIVDHVGFQRIAESNDDHKKEAMTQYRKKPNQEVDLDGLHFEAEVSCITSDGRGEQGIATAKLGTFDVARFMGCTVWHVTEEAKKRYYNPD